MEFGSCVYLIKSKNNILIDSGSHNNQKELLDELVKLNLTPFDINIVILTHGHFDHVGNIEIFEKAEIYGSNDDFNCKKVKDIKKLKLPGLNIIETPGHTKGSISLFLIKEKILFSGDTLFHDGIGRTDFPNSSPEDMKNSLNELKELKYKILCPGHI